MNFLKGNWIIATKEFKYSSGYLDRSYMDCAIMVTGVCDTHISYLGQWSTKEWIMPIDQVEGRGMIIAPDFIIEVSKQHMPWVLNFKAEIKSED